MVDEPMSFMVYINYIIIGFISLTVIICLFFIHEKKKRRTKAINSTDKMIWCCIFRVFFSFYDAYNGQLVILNIK